MAATHSRADALDGFVLPAGDRLPQAAAHWRALGFRVDAGEGGPEVALAGHVLHLDGGGNTRPLLRVRGAVTPVAQAGCSAALRVAAVACSGAGRAWPAEHPNGALRLAGATLGTRDPVAAARDCARLFGPGRLGGVAGGLRLTLADGFRVCFLSPPAIEQRYGTELADDFPRCVALGFETASLARTHAALKALGVPGSWTVGRRLAVPVRHPADMLISFEEPAAAMPAPQTDPRSHPTTERLH